jgi:AraC-like DNA-binding protein
MPRPRKEPPSPSPIAPVLARYARARGLDVELLACRFGLPADVEQRDEVPVAPETPDALLEWVARACGEPDLALHLGAAFPMRGYGFAELAARASTTLRQALGILARYAALLHADLQGALEEGPSGEGTAHWVVRTPRRPRGVGRHVHELVLAHALGQCRLGSNRAIAVDRVWFAHARPRRTEGLVAHFGTNELAFGCPDSGIAFSRGALDAAMPGVDPRMLATMEPLAEAALRARAGAAPSSPLSARVAERLAATLPEGADIADVARALHMSARTLQRRLEEGGTRFTELLDRARLELAVAALRDPRATLTEVAFRLGFSDLATFSRAFKRWTGEPPGLWRQRRSQP